MAKQQVEEHGRDHGPSHRRSGVARTGARCMLVLAVVLAVAGCGQESREERPAEARAPASEAVSEPKEGTAAVPDIVEEVQPSVVSVEVEAGDARGQGSGVIYDSDGIIVTNSHVVAGADSVFVVLLDGTRLEAEVRAQDPFTDLAVLEVDEEGLPAAEFSDALPRIGERAIALGNPLGFEHSVTAGIISGRNRSVPSGGRTPALVDLLQTDAPISPGNSGGALVGSDRRVLGINVAYIPPQARAESIGFAIPAPTVTSVVDELLERGRVEHAFLGVQAFPLTRTIAERFDLGTTEGVLVLAADPGSAAGEAGIRRGDVIVELAGTEIDRLEDLYSKLRDLEPDQQVPITVVRDEERRTFEVTLEGRPRPG